MPRRPKIWKIREDYRPLLKRIKRLFPNVLAHVKTKRILLVGVEAKKNAYMAQIRKNANPWAIALPDYDYVLTCWSTRFDNKPKSYRLYVMLHELLHIPEGGFDEDNKSAFRRLRTHDIEDFSQLLQAYGIRMSKVKDIYKGEKALFDRAIRKHKAPEHMEKIK